MTAVFGALCASVEITTANNTIIFDEDGNPDRTATIASGTYYLYGTDSTSDSLLKAITDALNTAPSATGTYSTDIDTVSPTASVTVRINFSVSGGPTTTTLQFADVLTTFDLGLVGIDSDFAIVGDQLTSEQPSIIWIPNQLIKENEEDRPSRNVKTNKSPNNARHHFVTGDVDYKRMFEVEWVDGARIFIDDPSEAARTYENFYTQYISDGRQFKYLAAASLTLSVSQEVETYVLLEPGRFGVARREHKGIAKHTLTAMWARYVS